MLEILGGLLLSTAISGVLPIVNAELVVQGFAWAYRQYLGEVQDDEQLCELEASAREARTDADDVACSRVIQPRSTARRRRRSVSGILKDCTAAAGFALHHRSSGVPS